MQLLHVHDYQNTRSLAAARGCSGFVCLMIVFSLYHVRKEVGLELFFPRELINSMKVESRNNYYIVI